RLDPRDRSRNVRLVLEGRTATNQFGQLVLQALSVLTSAQAFIGMPNVNQLTTFEAAEQHRLIRTICIYPYYSFHTLLGSYIKQGLSLFFNMVAEFDSWKRGILNESFEDLLATA